MKKILFRMSVIFLLFVMVVMNIGETAFARSEYKPRFFLKVLFQSALIQSSSFITRNQNN